MEIEVVLNYGYDEGEGYFQNFIELDKYDWYIYNDILHGKKLKINLYEEDIRELLKGTGIEIDGD